MFATKRGWHANGSGPPRQGKGSATVQPIRQMKHIAAVKATLASKPRDLALFIVGIHAGLRGSDLLLLRWCDVLSSEGRIRSVLEVTETKTGNRRRIAVSDTLRKALQNWHQSAGEVEDDDFIFPSRKGGSMTIQRLHQLLNEWTQSAKIQGHFGSHTLRKTYGYFLYKHGTDIALLMKIFGHSSQSITLRYIGIEQEEIDEANLQLEL